MAELKREKSNDTLTIPVEERSGVDLKKLNGEWVEYEYKDVRGLVDSEGQYKVILSGKEFLLLNGLKFPKTGWKRIIYQDILDREEYWMWEKVCNKPLNNRELTKLIKHRWVFLEEKDNKTIEVKVDGKFIMDKLESRMQDFYLYDEFWKRWYNRYMFKDKTRINIKLAVYDTELEVIIDKNDIENYYNAARIVTDRFNAYMVHYKKSKTEHEIALMTMIDLVLINT